MNEARAQAPSTSPPAAPGTPSAAPATPPAAPTTPPAATTPAAPKPPAPPPATKPADTPAATPEAAGKPAAPSERAPGARDGVVVLERAGKRLGQGVVLRSDGRILSALSALGHGNFVQARFADGTLLPVRAVHTDRRWDLALLETEGAKWTLGVRPSGIDVPAEGATLKRFRGRGLDAATATTAGRKALLGRDGVLLEDMLLLREPVPESDVGSPLFDEAGQVVALAVLACAPELTSDCRLAPHGAPVAALKAFLKHAPARPPRPSAAFGVNGVAGQEGSAAGVRVIAVEAGSPAARAGLRARSAAARGAEAEPGDLIVAVEGAPVATLDDLRDMIDRFATSQPTGPAAAGSERSVRLLLMRDGKFREVTVSLKPPLELPK